LRARQQVLDAVEAEMRERGLPVPPTPMSPVRLLITGFLCILILGLLVGLIIWELT
jgi:hypothetical protein